MKKLFLFWILILPFVFVACDSDDDNIIDETQIVGTWKATTIKPGISTGLGSVIDNALTDKLNDIISAEFNVGATIVFNSSGKFTDNIIGLTAGEYTVSGKSLTLASSLTEKSYTLTISQLNSTTMVLKMKSNYFSDLLSDYVESLLGVDIVFTCTKQ